MSRLALACIALLAVASCGAARPYPAKFRSDYLTACREVAHTTNRGSLILASCSCSLHYIEAHVPAKSAEAYDRAVMPHGRPIGPGVRAFGHYNPGNPTWLRAAIRACRQT